MRAGCGPLRPHRAIRLLHQVHSMHEVTKHRLEVLGSEVNFHFDSRTRTEDVGMGFKHLYMELDVLVWADGDLVECSIVHKEHARGGIGGAFGERVTESRNEGCEEYP